MDTGDVTTLANPDIVEVIRQDVQGKGPVVLKEGPEDVKRFGEIEWNVPGDQMAHRPGLTGPESRC